MKLNTLKSGVKTLDLRNVRTSSVESSWGSGRGGRPWRRIVERIKQRDKYTCQECGRVTTDGEVDHKVNTSNGGTDHESNLQWLCREPCHREKTLRESAAAAPQAVPK